MMNLGGRVDGEDDKASIIELMHPDITYKKFRSPGPRVRAPRKKVIVNRIGDTSVEFSQKKIGRPKSRIKRQQFSTMITLETREILRSRKMCLSKLLDLWIRTLKDEEINGREI